MLKKLFDSVFFKVLLLLFLLLLLCIPLGQIHDVVRERETYRQQAHTELAQTYAGPQRMVGPVLLVPYTERWSEERRDDKGVVTARIARSQRAVHLVLPQTLRLAGQLTPEERYRGIFKVLFYNLGGSLQAQFAAFDPAEVPRRYRDSAIELQTPLLSLGVSDLRGLAGAPALTVAGESLVFAQRAANVPSTYWLAQGIHAPLKGVALAAFNNGQPLAADMRLSLTGQQNLAVVPVAHETTASLQSAWPHPSFGGRFLASQRQVGDQGFDAQWRVSSLGSGVMQRLQELGSGSAEPLVPESAAAATAEDAGTSPAASGAARPRRVNLRDALAGLETFDVSLVEPQNVYAMSDRAIKYGALIVGLVLLAAFMFELFRQLRLHPVQYGLVGLSIALFFLLLLALSEKLPFAAAYASAAAASVLLLALYFSAVLRSWQRGALLSGFVAVLYGALYGLLASESNALILGTGLLFGMLALLMLATRRVDWYALSAATTAADRAAA